jgi:tubulin polyglutamylase TTLL6/13
VAQLYVTNPLLLSGRKFHLRLWMLVTGHAPLRAYMHTKGLVLFSSQPYDKSGCSAGEGGANVCGAL